MTDKKKASADVLFDCLALLQLVEDEEERRRIISALAVFFGCLTIKAKS